MIDFLSSTIGESTLTRFAIEVTIRATALMVLAFGCHAALGRRRALARSALWNATLLGLLLLPVASLAFPRVDVLIPSAPARPLVVSPVVEAPARESIAPVEMPFVAPIEPIDFQIDRNLRDYPVIETHKPPIAIATLVLGVYLAVAALLGIRLVVSVLAVERLRKRCRAIDPGAWTEAIDRWRGRLGIARAVTLLATSRVSIPVVVGWLRPAIILPEGLVGSANSGLIDAVLLHELGHVRRGDFGWNLVRMVTQIVYWPHPLVWLVGRTLGAVREQACDDLCVHALGGSSGYRDSLLEVASGLVRRPGPTIGLAMARTSKLGQRLAWIDRTRGASRCLLRWPARLAVAVVVATTAGLLGSLELARARAQEVPAPTPPQTKPAEGPPAAIEITVRSKNTGQPLEGARVKPYMDGKQPILKTDREGKLKIDLSRRESPETFCVDVWADDHVQQRFFFAEHDKRYSKLPAQLTVELWPGDETLGGTVNDEQGRPIGGVDVKVWGYLGSMKQKGELVFMVDATTDAQGRWRCRCFRKMQWANLYLSHPDYVADDQFHARGHRPPNPSASKDQDNKPMEGLRDFSDVQVMTRGFEVAGEVRDQQGKPIPGAEVGWMEEGSFNTLYSDLPKTTTDEQGRFRFPHVRPGEIVVQAKAKGHAPGLSPAEAKLGARSISITLEVPQSLTGRVVDTKGKPIAGASINVDTWRGSRALGVWLKTDAEGRFRWDDAPPDRVLLNAFKTGYDSLVGQRASIDEGEVVLTLARPLAISGTIRDAETGKAIDRADIDVGTPDPKTGEIRWVTDNEAFAVGGILQANLDAERSTEYRIGVHARGYEPAESRAFRSDEGQVEYDFKLVKKPSVPADIVKGVVLRPDGAPLQGAEVTLAYPMGGREGLLMVEITEGKIQPGQDQRIVKSDAQGRFSLTRVPDPAGRSFAVVVAHPDAYAEVSRAAIEADPTIRTKPWGRIEGQARTGAKPASGATLRVISDRLGNPDVPYVLGRNEVKADAEGRFVIERVILGDTKVFCVQEESPTTRPRSSSTLVEVQPGQTARADVGGKGRPVIARIALPEGFDPKADYLTNSQFQIESDRRSIPYPPEVFTRRAAPPAAEPKAARGNTEPVDDVAPRTDALVDWSKRWWASAEGHEYRRNWYSHHQAKLMPDGSIRVEDVPPGEYRLNLTYSADRIYGPTRLTSKIAYATKQFVIPEIPGGQTDEPFDLGTLRPKPSQELKVGQEAPAFEVDSLDGRRIKLTDFQGKYLLIDFWATWCGPCVAQIPELKTVHDQFAKDGRLAILSLSLDADKEAARKFVRDKEIPWAQGFVGPAGNGGVADAYHVDSLPTRVLVGPDGRIKAILFRDVSTTGVIEQALRAP